MAKKSNDGESRPRPPARVKAKPKPGDPPPVRLRPGEAEDEDEAEDLRPKAQKHLAAEFDDRGRKVNKKRRKMWRMISSIFLALTVMGAFIAGLVILFWSMRNPPPDPEMMAFVPANSTYIYGMHVKEARYNEKFRLKVDQALPNALPAYMGQVMKQLKLGISDLERVIIASDTPVSALALPSLTGNADARNRTGVTAILKLRKLKYFTQEELLKRDDPDEDIQFNRKEIQAATNSEELKHNGKRYFAGVTPSGSGYYYHVAGPHVMVIAESEKTLKSLLDKSDQEVVLTGQMRDFCDKYGGENFWFAIMPPENAWDVKSLAGVMSLPGGIMNGIPQNYTGFAYGGGVYGDRVHFTYAQYFPDEASVIKISSLFDGQMGKAKDMAAGISGESLSRADEMLLDMVKNSKGSSSGNIFQFHTRVRTWLMIELMEEGVKVGNQTIKIPLPFLQGPFAGLDKQQQQMFMPPPGQNGPTVIPFGPGGGIINP